MNCVGYGRNRTDLTRGYISALALETEENKDVQSGHLLNKGQQRWLRGRRWAVPVEIQSRTTIQWRAPVLGHVFKTLWKIEHTVPVIYLGCDGILVSCLPPAVLDLTANPFQETMHARKSRLCISARGCKLTPFWPFCCTDYRRNDDSGHSHQMVSLKI